MSKNFGGHIMAKLILGETRKFLAPPLEIAKVSIGIG